MTCNWLCSPGLDAHSYPQMSQVCFELWAKLVKLHCQWQSLAIARWSLLSSLRVGTALETRDLQDELSAAEASRPWGFVAHHLRSLWSVSLCPSLGLPHCQEPFRDSSCLGMWLLAILKTWPVLHGWAFSRDDLYSLIMPSLSSICWILTLSFQHTPMIFNHLL